MIALAVAATSLRRLVRDRTAMFFMLILPVGVILIIGMSMGGAQDLRVGLVDEGGGAEAATIRRELDASPALRVVAFDDVDAARTALRRVELDAVVVLPASLATVGAPGASVQIPVIGESTNGTTRAARAAVATVVAQRAAVLGAARSYADRSGVPFATARDAATALAADLPAVEVRTVVVDAESGYLPLGFDYSAPTMLTLFVFITSLAGGAAMIESRRLGIHSRMLAAPLTAGTIVAGEALSYFAVAVVQSAIIVGLGAFAFGVDWGDPVAALALVTLWALVGAGAGMLAGTLFRTPEQASSIGVAAGIGAGMLGGCMWPLEIVGSTMRTVGHAVPHAWAVDAWVELLSHGGGVTDIALPLTVLAGFALVLLAVASGRLRHRLTA